jgi:hypothetical protein
MVLQVGDLGVELGGLTGLLERQVGARVERIELGSQRHDPLLRLCNVLSRLFNQRAAVGQPVYEVLALPGARRGKAAPLVA